MRDFYAKDIRVQNSNISINKSKKLGEEVASKVINAADSLSQFMASLYPKGMLRFSVHGKPVNNANHKIGIYLNSLNDPCPMPWHGAAIKIPSNNSSEKFLYEKKLNLENAGAKLIKNTDDKGCYYQFPLNTTYDTRKTLKQNLSDIQSR